MKKCLDDASGCLTFGGALLPSCESGLEQEEWTGPWPHAKYSVRRDLARLQPYQCSKRSVRCIRGRIQKSGGSIDLPPTGQHGENSIHRLNGSIVPKTTIPGQLQLDHVKWTQ